MQSDSTQKKYIRRNCEDSFYSLCVSSSHTRRVRGGDAPVLLPEDQVRIVTIWNQLIRRKYRPIDCVGVEPDSQAWLVRQGQQAILDLERFRKKFFNEGITCLVNFDRDAVRGGCDKVGICHN